MQATIAELLNARKEQEANRKAIIASRIERGIAEHNTNVLTPQQMRDDIMVVRERAERNNAEKQRKANETRRAAMNDKLRQLRNGRNEIIQYMREISYSRKGRLVPKRKEIRIELDFMRERLDNANKQINALERKLGYTKQLSPRERRDMLIANGDVGTRELFELAERCRPPRGYPAPPLRRTETYPQGGLWGKPHNVPHIECMRGELDRLMKYCETIYNAERACVVCAQGEAGLEISLDGESLGGVTKEDKVWIACPSNPHATPTIHDSKEAAVAVIAISPRVNRMMDQIWRLNMYIKSAGSEKNIRRKQGTREYQERNDARA